MVKNLSVLLFIIVTLLLAGGGVFYWRQNQADVRELNKTLPEGVRVVKSLFGEEYGVVNEIDGYEFKVPEEWMELKDIDYISEREAAGYIGTSFSVEGNKGVGNVVAIDRYKSGGDNEENLESWAKSNFNAFGLVGEFTKDKVVESDVIKTQENIHLGGEYVYFFRKNKAVYAITGPSEELLRYIITNGKW